MRNNFLGILMFCLLTGNSSAFAAPPCLAYEPSPVQLTGHIRQETFPGRPNYTSIKDRDESEVSWILQLAEPLCVQNTPSDDMCESVSNETRVQLVLKAEHYRQFWRLLGRKVSVQGTLFCAHTGHHHTRVLVAVETMKQHEQSGQVSPRHSGLNKLGRSQGR